MNLKNLFVLFIIFTCTQASANRFCTYALTLKAQIATFFQKDQTNVGTQFADKTLKLASQMMSDWKYNIGQNPDSRDFAYLNSFPVLHATKQLQRLIDNVYSQMLIRSFTEQEREVLLLVVHDVHKYFFRLLDYAVWNNLSKRDMPTPNSFTLYARSNPFVEPDSNALTQFPSAKTFYQFLATYQKFQIIAKNIEYSEAHDLVLEHVVTYDRSGLHIIKLADQPGTNADLKAWAAYWLGVKPTTGTAPKKQIPSIPSHIFPSTK
ncbi:MAG: hypothetical protein AB7F59_10545 [Bdellovibrionales bacterium]